MQSKVLTDNRDNDISMRLRDLHDFLVRVAKSASLVGAGCGFIYLLIFTVHAGIPFPLELNVLPTTLLIVGLTSLLGSFILIAGMMVPAMTVDEFDVIDGYFKAFDCHTGVFKARIKRYFFCTWIPMATALMGLMFLTGIIDEQWEFKVLGIVVIAASAGWVFFTPKWLGKFLHKRWLYFFATFGQITMATMAYLLTFIVLVVMFPPIGQWSTWVEIPFALLVFSPIHALVSIPITKGGSALLQPPHFRRETVPAARLALVVATIWTFSSIMIPQVSTKVGSTVLRVFHVGGGIPVVICVKSNPPAQIATSFGFGADDCSAKIALKLDIGDRLYVARLGSAMGESVYFRQDDIRQKIYFRPIKNAP